MNNLKPSLSKPVLLAWVLCLGQLFGCSTPSQTLESKTLYEKDLKGSINGQSFVGTTTPKQAEKYDIVIEAPRRGDLDFVLFKSCSRQVKMEREGNSVRYSYVPMDTLENTGNCPLEVISLDNKGRHGWAFIAVPNDEKYDFPGYLRCSGYEGNTPKGTSICQSAHGLIQKIQFPKPMLVEPPNGKGCEIERAKNGKVFTYKMARGYCVFVFMEADLESDRMHIHYTFGFDEHVLRK